MCVCVYMHMYAVHTYVHMYVCMYRKSGNFHVKIIHVLNIHINLFSWVYGTHKNISHEHISHEHLLPLIVLLLMLRMTINLYYLATIVYNVINRSLLL